MTTSLKATLDLGAVGTAIGCIFDVLPHVSALLGVIWFIIRIYETRTIQQIVHPNKVHRTRTEDRK